MLLFSGSAHAEVLAFFDFNDASDDSLALDSSGSDNHGDILFAEYTDPGEGRTGGAGDRAMDFGAPGDGAFIEVLSAADGALESLIDNDAATLTVWTFGGDSQPANNWGFYIGVPSNRELGSHIPWGNGNVYFDTGGCCDPDERIFQAEPDDALYRDAWNHYAFVKDGEYSAIYQNGELFADSDDSDAPAGLKKPLGVIDMFNIGAGPDGVNNYNGLMDDFGLWDEALSEEQIQNVMNNGLGVGEPMLQAGDANMDYEFNQLDLVQVQIAAKYLAGAGATWGDGDWDGAPGGTAGSPPTGDGQFNQLDIISALGADVYLKGPYAALADPAPPNGDADEQTSIVYDPDTGELGVNAPASTNLTSVNIDSASGIFVNHEDAQHLDGSFDTSSDGNIFKATFGSSFGSLSFGAVAQPGLSEQAVIDDLTAIGSLEGGGGLGDVDLIYVPEPSTLLLLMLAIVGLAQVRRRRRDA